jgi:hypothetical protein
VLQPVSSSVRFTKSGMFAPMPRAMKAPRIIVLALGQGRSPLVGTSGHTTLELTWVSVGAAKARC